MISGDVALLAAVPRSRDVESAAWPWAADSCDENSASRAFSTSRRPPPATSPFFFSKSDSRAWACETRLRNSARRWSKNATNCRAGSVRSSSVVSR